MIEENKVITKYIADTTQEQRAINDLIKNVEKLKATEASAASAREGHFDQLILDISRTNKGVEEQAMSWDGLKKKGVKEHLESVTGGIQKVAQAMAPWNQAMELAGKALRFADESLDAAAKRYPQYADDVKKLKGEFSGLKESAQAVAGVMIVELAKPIPSIDELKKHTHDLELQWKNLLLTGSTTLNFAAFKDSGVAMLGGLERAFGGLTNAAEASLSGIKKGIEATAEAAAKLRAEMAALASRVAKEDTDKLLARLQMEQDVANTPRPTYNDYESNRVNTDAAQANISSVSGGIRQMQDALRAYQETQTPEAQEKTFLEKHFGKVEDFDAYAKGFEMLSGAVTAGLEAWIDGSESAGQAIKKFIASSLKALATQLAVEALKHGAYALGSLAFGDAAGASAHGAAAAEFGAASVAAAVAAKAMGGGGASAPSGGGGGGSGPNSSGGSGGGSNGGAGHDHRTGDGGDQKTAIIVYADAFADDSPRQRALRAEQLVKKATGGWGGEDN